MKKICHFVFVFLLLACAEVQAQQGFEQRFANQVIKPAELQQVEAGEILIWKSKNKLLGGTGLAYVAASPERAWAFIVGYADHPRFLPSIVKSEVLERQGDRLRLYTEYKTTWPFENIRLEADVSEKEGENLDRTMQYKARKTNLKAAYGGWVVRPYKAGTLVYYEMYFDVHYIPHVLISKLSRRAMRGVIEAMRENILKPTAS